jgi:hypothetical protein
MDSTEEEEEVEEAEAEPDPDPEDEGPISTLDPDSDVVQYSSAPCAAAAAAPSSTVSSATFERLAAPRLPTEDEDERYWSDAATVQFPDPAFFDCALHPPPSGSSASVTARKQAYA